jgi:endoglucanase
MFDLFATFPEYFSTLNLNIPESANSLADILDEALWALDFFCRLQEDDGSVRGGIEASGHPFFGEPSWLERHKLMAYHPGIWSTYLFAATAARASAILSPHNPERAEEYRNRALLAMQRAEELFTAEPNQPFQINDARNLAAIELLNLTQDPAWHQLFSQTTFLQTPGTPLFVYDHHDQAEAAWAYLQTPVEITDPEIRTNCINAILSSAEFLADAQDNAAFSWLKNPWRPPFSGAFTIPATRDVIRAWLLSGNPRYLAAVETSIQAAHGANPLNLSFSTGMGTTPVLHPNYPDARISRQNPPAGITVLGPLDLSFIGDAQNELLSNYGPYTYPDIRQWPVMETFLDVFWFPLMTEFSIETMATQVYTWGFLAAYPTSQNFPVSNPSQ